MSKGDVSFISFIYEVITSNIDLFQMVNNMPTVISDTEILNQKILTIKEELSEIKKKMEDVSRNLNKILQK